MSYYRNKKQAYNEIENLYKDGKKEDTIIFLIKKNYGFGEQMVKEHIQLLDRLSAQ